MTPGVSFGVAVRRAFNEGEKMSPTDLSMMARRWGSVGAADSRMTSKRRNMAGSMFSRELVSQSVGQALVSRNLLIFALLLRTGLPEPES